jgi:hypothetical protein
MYDAGKIGTGLIIFALLVTFPFHYQNIVGPSAKPDPKLDTPEIQKMEKETGKKQCIESKGFMRVGHMQLLNDWRDSVVRGGNMVYLGAEGKTYTMSLQNTCMKCHSNKKKFCDECHNYVAVKPYCWDCHIAPKEKET